MDRIWFHYRRESALKTAVQDGCIQPRRRFIFLDDGSPDLPDKAREAVLWGLHCPEPDICLTETPDHNPNVELIKKKSAGSEKLYLLRIVSPPSDDLYVADTAVFSDKRAKTLPASIGWHSKEGRRLREEYQEQYRPHYDRYWESLIPFDEYRPGSYAEPEVVCFSPIPLERLEVLRVIEDYYKPPKPLSAEAFQELLRDL